MEKVPLISAIVQVIIAIVLLFWGNKSIRLFLVLTGIIGGYTLGGLIVSTFEITGDLALVIPIAMAAITALLLSTMLSFTFFLAGMIVGWQVGTYALGIINTEFNYIVPILAAIAGGMLISMFQDEFIMIATAFLGAALLIDSGITFYHMYKGKSIQSQVDKSIFTKYFTTGENLIALTVVALTTFLGFRYQKKHD